MKKTVYGVLFLAVVGIGLVSCEKESLEQKMDLPNSKLSNDNKENASKALIFNYVLAVDNVNLELVRKKYDFNTNLFTNTNSVNNFSYNGIAAFDDDIASLEKTSSTESWIYYDSGSLWGVSGPVKYLGANILMDEIELLDDDINKLYGLRGSSIYKLTFDATTSSFNASIVYTYIPSGKGARRYSIAPTDVNGNFIRLYTAPSVAGLAGQPIPMTILSYVDINPTNGITTMPVNVSTMVPGVGDLSSFTVNNFSVGSQYDSKYYVVIDKSIYGLNTPTSLVWVDAFNNTVRDCSFYTF
ncbi:MULTISPECIES: hypothetical protein [Flavobacterium]|uniref:Uncharacterized protein n=1 Tax=Flavobacterium hankyongi TaxID=1176532 RepID=A0ABP8ZKF0_9FLAO|nr:hypothetical protein [Flavobacterium sp. N1846]